MTDELSRAFAALADPTRRDMVTRLVGGATTLTELAAGYDLTLQAVAKHVKVLENAGLVSRTRDAQRRPIQVEAKVLNMLTKWIERYQRQVEERYQRLDSILDDMQDSTTKQRKGIA